MTEMRKNRINPYKYIMKKRKRTNVLWMYLKNIHCVTERKEN